MSTELTDRERQVVLLITSGLSNREIGHRLDVSENTIKVHLRHIFVKLGIHNRTALAALVVRAIDRDN
jgi:two-component system, NarL family, nitrate/nitrite response regulator NarL